MNRLLKKITILGVLLTGLGGTASAGTEHPGEVLVKFKSHPAEAEVAAAAQSMGLASRAPEALQTALQARYAQQTVRLGASFDIQRWVLAEGEAVQATLAVLRASGLVEYAEPNYQRRKAVHLSAGPNDYHYVNDNQWWLEAVASDAAYAAGRIPSATTVVVAIVDSGINLGHEDLVDQLVTGRDYINVNGQGDDDEGHGTHVAGIVAASTNNSVGIAGVACGGSVKIMPIKVLGSDGVGFDSDIASGIVWAVDHGAKVLNLSFGSDSMGLTLRDAVNYADDHGCVVVAAAGNYAQDGNPVFYPAAYPPVIAVAAMTREGVWADYSEYHDYIDLAAPGGQGGAGNDAMLLSTYIFSPSTYAYSYGTSMASPVVAGAAALLLAQSPELTPSEVKNRLTMTASKVGSLATDSDGWNPYLGWGRVDVYAALNNTTTFSAKTSGRASYNFPNPFQPSRGERTEIVVPRSGDVVELTILDALGRLVYEKSFSGTGFYSGATVTWDGRDRHGSWVANGVYFYRLRVDGQVYENKIAVLNQ